MGECRGSWVVSRTGRAPSNIAVIKYWGKRNEKLILPVNSSISVTLNPEDLSATTTVAVSPSFSSDRLWLNDKEVSVDTERYQNCLREMRARARDMVDEKTGVTITKADWQDLKLHIASRNNFPTAAGLASSAAGFACLVYTIAQLMAVEETYEGELSAIARLGSGSACRSLYGGYVKWNMGTQDDGRDSIASQIAKHTAWDDLRIIIAVVSSKQKEVSSTSGMQDTVKTSSLLSYRAKEVVPKRMEAMEQAILNHDFHTFARITCADSNQFHATCLDTSPPVFYLNDTSRKIINLVERWNQFEGTPQVAYTFDAGPNAVLFVRERSAKCLLQRLLYQFPPPPGTDMSSYVVGDRKLLASSGIRSSKDVEHLLPPPELTNQSLLSRKEGEIAYLISTSPGEGPYLLQDPATILIDPNTVLPLCS